MKLLIITQKVDVQDSVLSFFLGWIVEFAKHFELVTVICLGKGDFDLPSNVKVLSLGKETKCSKRKYIGLFYRYIWREKNNYDAVFVHMNQEYVLMGGPTWRLLGKKVFMWRNHHAGSILTDLAAFYCNKVFCTSRYSYTAKYKKTIIMPVGVDADLFRPLPGISPRPKSILFLGRISPVKKPDLLVEALIELKTQGREFYADFYGDALPGDRGYLSSLKEIIEKSGLSDRVIVHPGVPNSSTVRIYNEHEIFVNLSSSGMYDKTIFEAMACERLILASNNNLKGMIESKFIFNEGDKAELTRKLEALLSESDEQKNVDGNALRTVVIERHSLAKLGDKLASIIDSSAHNL